MKKVLSPFFLFLSVWIAQLGSLTSSLANDSHVGEIRYSILSEDQFRRLYGTEWEILGGQPVPHDSELRDYWGSGNLPDARGVFLRGKNHNREKHTGNPTGDLDIGTYQEDSFKSHTHKDSGHRHTGRTEGSGLNYRFDSYPGMGIEAHRGQQTGATDHAHNFTTNFSSANIQATGGDETRPRNITVNTFVKVRESAPIVQETQISAEWVTRLFESAEFLRALREAITATARAVF
jgi:hypothetical protein